MSVRTAVLGVVILLSGCGTLKLDTPFGDFDTQGSDQHTLQYSGPGSVEIKLNEH